MINVFAFSITFLQLAILALAYLQSWNELFDLFVYHFSPITVLFGLMGTVVEFTTEFSFWTVIGAVYCFIKYFIISRAMAHDGIGFFDASAIFMEILYLAGSGWYIFYYSFYAPAVS